MLHFKENFGQPSPLNSSFWTGVGYSNGLWLGTIMHLELGKERRVRDTKAKATNKRVSYCKQTSSKVVWVLIMNGVEGSSQILFYLTRTEFRSGVSHNLKKPKSCSLLWLQRTLGAVELAWFCWRGKKWLLDTMQEASLVDQLLCGSISHGSLWNGFL